MSDHWLQVENLCRYYRRGPQEVRAVDRASFSLPKGEFAAIVGASGAGKSTVLNLLTGLDKPTSGKVVIGGLSISDLSRKQLSEFRAHQTGIIFQSFNLIPHYSALKNVELALVFLEFSAGERRARATETLTRLGLGDRMTHKPGDLSGGEQQRVAIARAIVKNPDLILADEPTGNLDHDNTRQIMKYLEDLNNRGMTVILVTHDTEMASHCARRIIKMQYGRIISDNFNKINQVDAE
jgi:ABC-type lipoprotein export system ATPase subunit